MYILTNSFRYYLDMKFVILIHTFNSGFSMKTTVGSSPYSGLIYREGAFSMDPS